MMASPKWPQNKYYGKTVDQIKALWDKNRDIAASMGTYMHYMIEMFMNICVVLNGLIYIIIRDVRHIIGIILICMLLLSEIFIII